MEKKLEELLLDSTIINEILTDTDFKFNRPVYIKHHRSFIKTSEQLVFAAAQKWLKEKQRYQCLSTRVCMYTFIHSEVIIPLICVRFSFGSTTVKKY